MKKAIIILLALGVIVGIVAYNMKASAAESEEGEEDETELSDEEKILKKTEAERISENNRLKENIEKVQKENPGLSPAEVMTKVVIMTGGRPGAVKVPTV